jgi:hypothetical protein
METKVTIVTEDKAENCIQVNRGDYVHVKNILNNERDFNGIVTRFGSEMLIVDVETGEYLALASRYAILGEAIRNEWKVTKIYKAVKIELEDN